MMRRRLPQATIASAVWDAQSHPLRHQSGGSSGGLHTFIRDQQATARSQPSGFHPPGTVSGSPEAEAAALKSDWAVRLQRELSSEADPMGGMAHVNYYRDPAAGYSPQYAPRNFGDGGAIAYHHLSSPVQHMGAAAQRDWHQHEVDHQHDAARRTRAAVRGLESDVERARYLQSQVPPDRFAHHLRENQSLRLEDQLLHSTVTSGDKLRQQLVVDRHAHAVASASAAAPSLTAGSLDRDAMQEHLTRMAAGAYDTFLEENLHVVHGLRAKERFDFNVMQRMTRLPFQGYDRDRFTAHRAGRTYGGQPLAPTVAPSSMEEALKALRQGGAAAVPAVEAQARAAYARNTVRDQPTLGEGLTEEIVRQARGAEEERQHKREQGRNQRLGIGRQGALVQDGGPDRRTLRKHTNDERLIDAMRFSSNAYRQTRTDEHRDPYQRGNTERGVAHLLQNHFDVARRDDRTSRGEADLTERSMVHYGTPIQQSIDEFVFRHRNARGERPLDYFKPFPHFRAQRLNTGMYQDTEGFALMKQRPDFLEWELFTRYRAHHQQRRELALRHGLEPVANETATERQARRLKLDQLCEATPFDPSRVSHNDDEQPVDAETLRKWFGVFMLPSPTVAAAALHPDASQRTIGLHLQHAKDEMGTADTREHLLSARYLSEMLLHEGFLHRVGRQTALQVGSGTAPEPVIKYAQPPEVLRQFSAEEQAMYHDYVRQETQRQREHWLRLQQGRRFVAERGGGQYGQCIAQGSPVLVVDLVPATADDGAAAATPLPEAEDSAAQGLTVAVSSIEEQWTAAEAAASRDGRSSAATATTAAGVVVQVDGRPYRVVQSTERSVVPLTIQLESGEVYDTTSEAWSQLPLEVAASPLHNHALDYGIVPDSHGGGYAYNRGNYIETQDVLWEQATAAGVEGWSPATHADGLRLGLPVRARRELATAGPAATAAATGRSDLQEAAGAADAPPRITGDYQRARIVEYLKQPFFNPEPRLVTVAFESDGAVQHVPLADVLIWQRRYHGPERTVADESRRYSPLGLRRYVDVADPHNERSPNAKGTAGSAAEEHFLEKYEQRNAETAAAKFRSTKQITELDGWTRHDTRRAENYRPLGISHRRDYVWQGYMPRYTPWEWIAVQEAEQPIIADTIRQDDMGSSYFFSLNRFWRYKARPHGYIRNYEKEVRDLFQFVDGVTPWEKAQRIRTYWEVRQHHPMPQFNRPEVAMHRNTAGLLPAHMWETDKKTGKVKGVKDSVRDYQTKTPLPTWVQM